MPTSSFDIKRANNARRVLEIYYELYERKEIEKSKLIGKNAEAKIFAIIFLSNAARRGSASNCGLCNCFNTYAEQRIVRQRRDNLFVYLFVLVLRTLRAIICAYVRITLFLATELWFVYLYE